MKYEKYVIIDWASNICFNSDFENFIDYDAASESLDSILYQLHGENCDIDKEREEYSIVPVCSNDKIMGNVLYTFN